MLYDRIEGWSVMLLVSAAASWGLVGKISLYADWMDSHLHVLVFIVLWLAFLHGTTVACRLIDGRDKHGDRQGY